ncbi:hypothetical protein EV138_0542 [Kribbella voronezhensis]|uniref:Uncharacterized protein n=1 Tax=Kribbella voronezhensis TaxID=2512212 RepID=A0A4R7T5R8_9ACTN|nr:hypothetical protein [Kribbella voronezhensis]TDU87025.1 hypothetical protein EV138_0542 [Kribbella voronezhensis]
MTKEPVGSVAEEAAKLFAVLQQATTEAKGQHSSHQEPVHEEPADEAADEHEHGTAHRGGPECQWCPVCQLIAKVRTTSPETIEQLSSAAAGVLGSLRSLLEAAAEAARQARADAESRTAEDPGEQPARSRVDRIDVSEDPEPWD